MDQLSGAPARGTPERDAPDLADAFDRALRQVERALASDLRTASGESAVPELEQLREDLLSAREAALARGAVDAAWVRRTVRGVAGWTPEAELPLLAALGAIARAGRTPPVS